MSNEEYHHHSDRYQTGWDWILAGLIVYGIIVGGGFFLAWTYIFKEVVVL